MDFENKIALLKRTELLGSLDESRLRELCGRCREIHLPVSKILFREGAAARVMYVILEGELLIYKPYKQIAVAGPGEYLGEMALIEAKPRSASVKARREARLLEINKESFDKYIVTAPRAMSSIIRTLSGRIRNDLDIISHDIQGMSILAHDMRNCLTPLGLVEGVLEDLLDNDRGIGDKGDDSGYGDDIQKSLDHLINVTDNLSALIAQSLGQISKISVTYTKPKTDVIELAREAVDELSHHKALQGKELKVVVGNRTLEACFNPLDVKRVLHNLIINAAEVTEGGGTIIVTVRKDADGIRVAVVDEGPGIAEEIRPLLMKSAVTTKDYGTGLGLLSCREIIEERHQGRLWYESELGKGTRFCFTLPASSRG